MLFKICREIRAKISCAFLAGRKVLPRFHQIFPIRDAKFQIKFQILFTKNSGKRKAHKHKLFDPVGFGTARVCPWDKPDSSGTNPVVPGTNPGFLLVLHSGSPVCPRDKPSLSLGQTRGRRAAEKVYVLKVYVPFSLAKNFTKESWTCSGP